MQKNGEDVNSADKIVLSKLKEGMVCSLIGMIYFATFLVKVEGHNCTVDILHVSLCNVSRPNNVPLALSSSNTTVLSFPLQTK